MISIDVRGLAEVQSKLKALASDQIPYATMVAINNTAFACQKVSQNILRSSFDRPTPLITGATRVEKATKETLTARVFIDPKRVGVLITHERGGQRGLQGLEKIMRSNGFLPSGYRVVPAKGLELDQYGNAPRTLVTNIKKWLASGEYRISRNRRYFVIPVGSKAHLSPGIYLEGSGGSGKGTGGYRMRLHTGLFMIVREAVYRKRFPLIENIFDEALKVLPNETDKAIQRAIETAR